MLRITIISFFSIISLLASDSQSIYEKAQKYEQEGNYKEAMLLYKQLAKNDKPDTEESSLSRNNFV